MKYKNKKEPLLIPFISLVKEMGLTALKLLIFFIVTWYVFSGIFNSLPVVK